MGRFDQAKAVFSRILLLDSRNVEALCGIAGTYKAKPDDPLIESLEKLLRDPTLRDDERATLHHAYGKICNDIGRFDDAFAHYTRGKQLKKLKFHMELHHATYAASMKIFTRAFFAERTDFGVQDKRPVFIVGMPRSGTTLTEQILASHPAIAGLGELPYLRKIASGLSFGSADPLDFTRKVAGLSAADVVGLANAYCDACARTSKQAMRMVDKSPHNYELLGLIGLMFPHAKIIHCRRSALDNCVAVYMQNFNESHSYNGDLATLGAYYREYQGLMSHWQSVFPLKILDVDYENTVTDLEAEARKLIRHLDVDWDDSCLRYYEQDRQVTTPSRWQVRQPIYDSSVGRWKNYEKFLEPLKAALA